MPRADMQWCGGATTVSYLAEVAASTNRILSGGVSIATKWDCLARHMATEMREKGVAKPVDVTVRVDRLVSAISESEDVANKLEDAMYEQA